MNDKILLSLARLARENAYVPYSGFKVGAAILTGSGKVYTGCNIENSSYGGSICAERTAAVKAVSDGEKEFLKIAIVSSSEEFTYPCGICRQFLSEFFKEEGKVILEDKEKGIMEVDFWKLIPSAFSGSDIK